MKSPLFVITTILVQRLAASAFCANRPLREHLLTDYNWIFIRADAKGAENPGGMVFVRHKFRGLR